MLRVSKLKAFASLSAIAAAIAGTVLCAPANASPSHGVSAFGALKYPPDFKHFEYVNPDAPKGGRLSLVGSGARTTFDSFNPFILKGDAAQGLTELMFETLMTRADDEPDAMYGLIARTVDVAADKQSARFELRPEARFSDGSPITSADVCYSFDTLKSKGHPLYRTVLRDVNGCRADAPLSVVYTFKGQQLRDLPLIVAGLPVISKAYYANVNFEETSLTPPLGSGPYKVASFKQGTSVIYRRRDDYWAKDLPVMRGRFNFDEIRYEYFRDRTAQLESFKAGDYEFREEFTSRDWATAYDIPQVRDGRIVRLVLPDARPGGAQGFFINTRRPQLSDVRVRQALDLAFDFEWTNKNLFYGLYTRTASYFENSDMKAVGPPSKAELALLEPYRGRVPGSVFAAPYAPPVTNGSGSDRKLLRRASQLLQASGWKLGEGGVLRNARNDTLDVEFLSTDPTTDRIAGPYVRNLKLLGINAFIRRVDAAQYERRLKSFDFDVLTQRYVLRLTPGPELYSYFGLQAAKTDGSFNLAGIADPVVDALVAKVLEAGSREALVVATRALDRVLRAGHYWVPHWYKASHTIAYWNKYARPAIKPKYGRGVIDTWWYDAAKAARLDAPPPSRAQ